MHVIEFGGLGSGLAVQETVKAPPFNGKRINVHSIGVIAELVICQQRLVVHKT